VLRRSRRHSKLRRFATPSRDRFLLSCSRRALLCPDPEAPAIAVGASGIFQAWRHRVEPVVEAHASAAWPRKRATTEHVHVAPVTHTGQTPLHYPSRSTYPSRGATRQRALSLSTGCMPVSKTGRPGSIPGRGAMICDGAGTPALVSAERADQKTRR
jgi:hypothetical protein